MKPSVPIRCCHLLRLQLHLVGIVRSSDDLVLLQVVKALLLLERPLFLLLAENFIAFDTLG